MKTIGNDFNKKFSTITFIVLLFSMLISCSKSSSYTAPTTGGSGNPPASEVWIQGYAFNPVSITVAVNTTVKWTNMDAVAHTVTSNATLFDSGNINSNGIFSFTFTTKGTFSYHCSIHPGMTGTVVVQ